MTGASGMDIHNELVARHAELREAGLFLADAAGVPVDVSFLAGLRRPAPLGWRPRLA
jgi:hypothetical protein